MPIDVDQLIQRQKRERAKTKADRARVSKRLAKLRNWTPGALEQARDLGIDQGKLDAWNAATKAKLESFRDEAHKVVMDTYGNLGKVAGAKKYIVGAADQYPQWIQFPTANRGVAGTNSKYILTPAGLRYAGQRLRKQWP